jgi:hypothetical protein
MKITLEHKRAAKKQFDGSIALFESCWRQYCLFLRGAIDEPLDQSDINNWLEQIACDKVNNPRSKFYIYG